MKVTVVGSGSFIAQALRRCAAATDWRYLGHAEALADTAWARDSDVVLNCAFDDRLKDAEYQPSLDIDLRLARSVLPQAHLRYVMLSSRTVYGTAPADGRLHEHLPAAPRSPYAKAKWQTETALAEMLGERLTIFRLSNIFGHEDLPGRRNFFAQALRSLRGQGRIVLDISPFVERDFLPVEHCADQLAGAMRQLRGGTFHLGAGFGVPVGQISQWILEGFGSGELLVTNVREFDAFWLDMARTRAAFDTKTLTLEQLRAACHAVGQHLCEARAHAVAGG